MLNMLKQVADMKNQIGKVREIMQRVTATAEAGGGMVKVTANGNQRILKIELDPEIVDPNDMEMLSDLIIAGVNKALDEAAEAGQNELRDQADSFLPKDMDLSKFGL